MTITIKKDIIILGGGIAGLWLLNRLRNEGFDALLLEQDSLGSGQSIASQGMIHGGIKYALNGSLTAASNAIADMPAHWKACLEGKGDVDLRGTNILSEQYFMWPRSSMRSRLNAFLGSKALRGRVDAINKNDYPTFFQQKIKGPLYQLSDIVLDVPSLLSTLAQAHHTQVRKIDWQQSKLIQNENGEIHSIQINANATTEAIHIQAQRYITTSGAGTADLLKQLNLEPAIQMQVRPLQMVVVKHQICDPIFVHCIAEQISSTPEVTITTHQCKDGSWAWYLGGELAEAGASRSPDEQLSAAKDKIKELFPWCDLEQAQWHSFYINRAEAKQKNGKRPEHSSLLHKENIFACWPTKLTLAPNLANDVIELLSAQDVTPKKYQNQTELSAHLPFPELATTPWDAMSV